MKIIGHQKVIKLLDKAITKNSVSHAYLFCGPEHLGKFTIALDFARRLAGGGAGINPDLVIVKSEIEEKKGVIKKLDIKVEQIRDMQHQLSLTATGGKYKVAIIDDADRMNKTAQNAMLKTLEEPNEKVILILVARDEKRLLPTIMSRCQRIKFGPVGAKELKAALTPGESGGGEILFWSLGRPGLMFSLMNDAKEINFRKQALQELREALSQNLNKKFELAEKMSKDALDTAKKLDLWTIFLRENMLGRHRDTVSQERAFIIIKNINESLQLIGETNSSARLVLENLFLHF